MLIIFPPFFSQNQPFVRVPVILHTISSLGRPVMEKSALAIVKGLSLCLRGSRPLRNGIVNTPDFWSTLSGLHANGEVAGDVFDLLMGVMDDTASAVTADNYESAILLLNDFATAGSSGALLEQKRDRNPRRPKGGRHEAAPWVSHRHG
jgi:golgi-specific brefeldin A-resistance guanine nucleotide exchange factor 1